MNKLNRIVLIISLVFCLCCLGASIWMASVLRDQTSYVMATIFLLGSIWLGVNVWRSRKE
jgi:hypothetical protein